jgi:predicted 2-oxoglutarate/Fe(II)-dependent dioxygenase YbiX
MTRVIEVDRVWSRERCAELARALERRGYRGAGADYPRTYRTSDRLELEDAALARSLFESLQGQLPEQLDHQGRRWGLQGINPRFRSCRYRRGQSFSRHRDGVFHQGDQARSLLSLVLYLDDGAPERGARFGGGRTRVFADRWSSQVVQAIEPRAGKVAIFEHSIWHDAEPVDWGTKRVLRSDVLYRPLGEAGGAAEAGHRGYVWSLAAIPGGFVSGGRDTTLRSWRLEAGAMVPVAVGRAHDRSVTALAAAGDRIASGSRDRRIAWWHSDRGRLTLLGERELAGGAVLSLAACADGGWIAGAADGTLSWIDPWGRVGARIDTGQGWIWSVVELAPGLWATAGEDGTVRAFRRGQRGLERGAVVQARDVALRSLVALDRGIAAGAVDGTITCLTLDQRWVDHQVVPAHRGAVTTLAAWGPRMLASGGEDDRVRVWARGSWVLRGVRRHRDFVRALCASEGALVSAGYDGRLKSEADFSG